MKILRVSITVLVLTMAARASAVDSLDDGLAKLQQILLKSSPDRAAQVNEFIGTVQTSITRGDDLSAEELLVGLKSGLLAGNAEGGRLVDQILDELQAKSKARGASVEVVLDTVTGDFRAKLAAHEPAGAYDSLLDLLAKLNPPVDTGGNNSVALRLNETREFIAGWQNYLDLTARGEYGKATGVLNDLVNRSASLPVAPRSELIAIQSESAARVTAVQDRKLAEVRRKFADLQRRVVAAIDNAKTPADLDPILSELTSTQFGDPVLGFNAEVRDMQAQLRPILNFVQRWQEYLIDRTSGKVPAAFDILRDLANDAGNDAIYPRSRTLDRLNGMDAMDAGKAKPPPEIAPGALTLETLDQLAEQLGPPRLTGGYAGVLSGVVQTMYEAKTELRNGNPQPAMALLNNGNFGVQTAPYTAALLRIRMQLIMAALPRDLRVPEGLAPAADEALPAYLSRLLKRANETQDWPLAYRVLMVARSSPWEMPSSDLSLDVASYAEFFAGLNMEKAGQIGPAVRSYLDSLRVAGPDLPREEIGRRLRQLKEAHQKDVEAAETLAEPASVPSPRGGFNPTELQAMRMRLQHMSTAFPAPPEPESPPAAAGH